MYMIFHWLLVVIMHIFHQWNVDNGTEWIWICVQRADALSCTKTKNKADNGLETWSYMIQSSLWVKSSAMLSYFHCLRTRTSFLEICRSSFWRLPAKRLASLRPWKHFLKFITLHHIKSHHGFPIPPTMAICSYQRSISIYIKTKLFHYASHLTN